jgi:AcrR family transcriptional regulator
MAKLIRRTVKESKGEHPTRALLVDLAVGQLENRLPEEITIDSIVAASGLTKGAIYHHFSDFGELIEAALVVRFTRFVDESIVSLTEMASSARSREEILAGMAAVTAATQRPDRKPIRFARAHVLTLASRNPRLAETLDAEQLRLTDALANLIASAQQRGWFSADFDPRAAAVMIQAYTLGRIVDDITTRPVDPAEWERLITRLIERVFAT